MDLYYFAKNVKVHGMNNSCKLLALIRPKKNMSVSSDMSKNIRVGRSEKSFFFIFYFFFKVVMTKLFSNQFCFFYI